MNPNQGPGAPSSASIDPAQKIETDSYVPTYTIKPEFQKAVLAAIGKYPFNQIQQIMNAVKVNKMDHNQLNQMMNALGSFPYQDIAGLMDTVNNYLVMDEPPDDEPDDDPPDDGPADDGPAEDSLEAAIGSTPSEK